MVARGVQPIVVVPQQDLWGGHARFGMLFQSQHKLGQPRRFDLGVVVENDQDFPVGCS